MDRLIIDWSIFCAHIWYRMGGDKYVHVKDTELSEFTFNLGKELFYVMNRFKGYDIYLATDDPNGYWRHDYYSKWYEKFGIKCFMIEAEDKPTMYYLEYDNEVHKTYYWDAKKEWISYRLKKKEVDEIDWEGAVELTIAEMPEGVKGFFPRYKGDRGGNWNYQTPYLEYKKLIRNLAKNIPGVKPITVAKAEADDIAFTTACIWPGDNLTYITFDEDWQQIGIKTMFAKSIDPRDWSERIMDGTRAKITLISKIMCGDSDNIPKIMWKPGAKKIALKSVDVFIANRGLKGALDYLKENGEEKTVNRNMKLVYMGNTPKEVTADITKALKTTKPNPGVFDWAKYGLTTAERLTIMARIKKESLNG